MLEEEDYIVCVCVCVCVCVKEPPLEEGSSCKKGTITTQS